MRSPPPSPDRPKAPTRPAQRDRSRPARLLAIEPAALRPARKGRGARANPTGRFERARIEPDLEALADSLLADHVLADYAPADHAPADPSPTDQALAEAGCGSTDRAQAEPALAPEPPVSPLSALSPEPPLSPERLETQTLPDPSRSAIVYNQSPDIPFDASLNPYRGCEHGCAYCYARPTHEYLGYSAGLDFETKILVKEGAPALLRRELSSPRWKPQVVAISGVTDAYQPLERRLGLTRRCVEVFVEFRNPITIITKNALVARDIDLLRELNEHRAVSVSLSITTLDAALQRVLEPRASAPHERLRAVEKLAEAGIPTGVMVAPIIPGLTDHETPALLAAAAAAGATGAGHILLRLPHGLRDLFDDWLMTHRPLRREKVLRRLESLRGGRLNDPRFGSRMRGEGRFAEQIGDVFRLWARKHGLDGPHPTLSTEAFRRPGGQQLSLGL